MVHAWLKLWLLACVAKRFSRNLRLLIVPCLTCGCSPLERVAVVPGPVRNRRQQGYHNSSAEDLHHDLKALQQEATAKPNTSRYQDEHKTYLLGELLALEIHAAGSGGQPRGVMPVITGRRQRAKMLTNFNTGLGLLYGRSTYDLIRLVLHERERENFTSPFSQHWLMRTRLCWSHQPH